MNEDHIVGCHDLVLIHHLLQRRANLCTLCRFYVSSIQPSVSDEEDHIVGCHDLVLIHHLLQRRANFWISKCLHTGATVFLAIDGTVGLLFDSFNRERLSSLSLKHPEEPGLEDFKAVVGYGSWSDLRNGVV